MRRRHDNVMDIEDDDIASEYSESKTKNSIHEVPTFVAFGFLGCLLALLVGVWYTDSLLPTPLMISDEKDYPNDFIAERARNTLELLTNIGPRVIGSDENEVQAVELLVKQINKIIKEKHPHQFIEIEHQTSSGSYYLGYKPTGFINVYSDVQNIMVKVNGLNATSSLLINAHYDSVPTSPGASDDGIMCSVMMEILRKMSQLPERTTHNVIFLFNGAEELVLEASHGFVTQHKWAEETKVLINLEAAGHGGKEILFQTGPRTNWLMKYYKDVPYPSGQAAGEEIFQSDLLPSDTDFRIFRDFGNLVGYDFAFARNGYRYHTKYDSFKEIPLGSYQHVGSNILHLVKGLANAPELEKPEMHGRQNVVYFDFFGRFMITYSQTLAIILNLLVVVISFCIGVICLREFGHYITCFSFKYIVISYFVILMGWVTSAAAVYGISLVLDKTDNTMSWYGKPYILCGLYCAPVLASMLIWFNFINYCRRQNKLSISSQTQINLHLTRLMWTLVLFIGTCLNIRSCYALMIPVLFSSLCFVLLKISRQIYSKRIWQILYTISIIIPTAFLMSQGVLMLSLFIPMTGRIGSDKNPELIIGAVTGFLTVVISSYSIPLITLVKRQRTIVFALLAIFIATFACVLTPIGFPYSGDPDAPRPERFMIYHTNRNHRNNTNDVIETKSGIFLYNMDRNSPHYIRRYVKEFSHSAPFEEDCKKYLCCGFPIMSPRMVSNVKESSTWIPFESAPDVALASIELSSSVKLMENVVQLNFLAKGPNHLNIYMKPREQLKILKTSWTDIISEHLVFVHCISGKANPTYNFTVDIEVPKGWTQPMLDIAISGKYMYGNQEKSQGFNRFIQQFPSWADLVIFTAGYDSYVF